jgi:CubicO group peptidase (beta-lactamase class C family)
MKGIQRRTLLASGLGVPALWSCASDVTQRRQWPAQAVADHLKVCAAAYNVLHAGAPGNTTTLAGCAGSELPVNPVFQAASLTKPVVAHATLQLVMSGRLDLDAPVSHYLPQGYRRFRNLLKRAPTDDHEVLPASVLHAVSVAHLLNHSAGFPNWAGGALKVDFAPGTRWRYSGEGYMLLQGVLEAVTGQDLATHLNEAVFNPLSMADSSLVWRDAWGSRAVEGIGVLGIRSRLRFHVPVAAASLCTTATDYALFMAAVLRDEKMLAMILSRPVPVDPALGLQWGLGWGIESASDGPRLWQWGNNPGFRAFAMASLRSRDGFVVLSNSDRGMPLAASLAHQVMPGETRALRFPMVG